MSYLCEGSCRGVEFIGKGLCHTLDVAVVTLEAVEKASGWVNAAVQYVLTQLFRIYRYDEVVDPLICAVYGTLKGTGISKSPERALF